MRDACLVGFPCLADPTTAMNNRLRELRAERRWSQAQLADRLGVSRQTVNAIETGRYDPSLPLAFKLATVFNKTIESIFASDVDDVEDTPS